MPEGSDPNERILFGHAILNNDFAKAQRGSITIHELREVPTRQRIEVDRDLHRKPPHSDDVGAIRSP
ncbi:MAG: hypothetical protein JSU86_04270 [Phycisphaerales bacterium]|nr:MAG: hypothetical protein JSU86_04270 [Phycisphaerales bacterium]